MQVSEDQSKIYFYSSDNTIQTINTKSGEVKFTVTKDEVLYLDYTMAINTKENLIAFGRHGNQIRVTDLEGNIRITTA